ncbi:MAG: hypothetical protein RL424_542 [Pseudomonadota bacterium]
MRQPVRLPPRLQQVQQAQPQLQVPQPAAAGWAPWLESLQASVSRLWPPT